MPEARTATGTAIHKHVDRVLARFLGGLLPEEKRYWVLVPVTGVLSGFAAVGLQKLLAWVHRVAWGTDSGIVNAAKDAANSSPLFVLLPPLFGGILVAIALVFIRKKGQLQGTPALIEALAFNNGRLPPLRSILEGIVSVTAVGTGASLGREGAMIQSGAALGSWLGVKLRLDDAHVRVLLACGAAGGIAASYRVPIGASVFAMEVLLGSFALDLFGPIIICTVISTTIARVLVGGLPAYDIPSYELVREWEILLDLLLGIFMGLISVIFIRVFSGVGKMFRWLDPIARLRPVVAMVLLALIGFKLPHLFGNGYDTVDLVLKRNGGLSLGLLITLPILKILVTALCRAGGVPGGLFTPSLFVGALLGAAFGEGVHAVFPEGTVATPGAYALVGMGAILAGTIQAPITAILMIFEMTQGKDYEIILPLMSACIASALVSHLFQEGSLYTEPLRRSGLLLPRAIEPSWLRQPSVRSMVSFDAATVSPAARFEEVMESLLGAPEGHAELYVTTAERKLLGVISLHAIKKLFRETEHLDSIIAADLLDASVSVVLASDPISRAIEILAESDAELLPVIEDVESRRFVGTLSKRALLSAYTRTNLAHHTVVKTR